MPNPKGLSIRIKIPTRVQPEVVPPPDRPGQYTNKIHHIKKYLLEELGYKEFALPFMEPVDTKALNVPTYYTVIEHPMDMGTVAQRVDNQYYRSVNELISDIRLVIRNCFTFNMPEAMVYRDGQELEKFFEKVLEKMPKGEEFPYDKERGAKSIMRHQCRFRMKKLQETAEQLEHDAQTFFLGKWLCICEELNNSNIKSLKQFDIQLDKILKHCHEHGKRILETYDYEVNRLDHEAVGDKVDGASSVCPCRKPPVEWEYGLVDALDDTVLCLRQDLAQSQLGEQKKDRQIYSEMLLPVFANAQVISEGIRTLTSLPDSSDEEEVEEKPDRVSETDRQIIRKHFHRLKPETMYDIMHIVEQAEFCPDAKGGRVYNMIHFKPQTISLLKQIIAGHSKPSPMERKLVENNQGELGQMGGPNDSVKVVVQQAEALHSSAPAESDGSDSSSESELGCVQTLPDKLYNKENWI